MRFVGILKDLDAAPVADDHAVLALRQVFTEIAFSESNTTS